MPGYEARYFERMEGHADLLRELWGSERMLTRGCMHVPARLPGFACFEASQPDPLGLITCQVRQGECEVVTLNSLRPGQGVGSALLQAVEDLARRAGCSRVWLIATNDNLPALGFYQRRGYRLKALYPGAVDRARQLKPEIPLRGLEGIPLRDEIELEKRLD